MPTTQPGALNTGNPATPAINSRELFFIFLIDDGTAPDKTKAVPEKPCMNRTFLTPPLNQAVESGSGAAGFSNGITRRSFLKRTGAASVATPVAWNSTQHHARATETNGGSDEYPGSGSEWMCAVSPPSQNTLIGHVSLAGGGYIFLYFDDYGCYHSINRCHRKKTLRSGARLRAEAWIPAKSDQTPWQIYPQNDIIAFWEEKSFNIVNEQIVRTGEKQLPLVIDQRIVMTKPNEELDGDPVPILSFCLEIANIIRSPNAVEIQGRAWLEGEIGEQQYDDSEAAEGWGITVVAINPQDPHQPAQCEVST